MLIFGLEIPLSGEISLKVGLMHSMMMMNFWSQMMRPQLWLIMKKMQEAMRNELVQNDSAACALISLNFSQFS